MSLDRKSAHAALTGASLVGRGDFDRLAHDIVDNLCDVIESVAKQAAAQSVEHVRRLRAVVDALEKADAERAEMIEEHRRQIKIAQAENIGRVMARAVPAPSNETEAEKLQARQVKAIETIALALTLIANKDQQ